jgi:ribosomal protein S18 acetylase RimI-like enzyme
MHPAHTTALGAEVLAWCAERAQALARLTDGHLTWWMAAREGDPEQIALLEENEFHRAGWTMLRYERALAEPLPSPTMPEGYVVRPLRGVEEVPAYVVAHRAAFGSTSMTEEWRERILQVPGYRPELDLIVAAPDGRVAAFAILWLGPESSGRCEGQFEPVGTHPDFQRCGLGRALMLEGMRRLRASSATHAIVETETVRVAANGLYGSLMRQGSVRTLYYRKDL